MNKDQSYYLSQVASSQLERAVFSLADIPKPKVRDLARAFKLPTAEREESMGVCFIGERGKFGDFVCKHDDKGVADKSSIHVSASTRSLCYPRREARCSTSRRLLLHHRSTSQNRWDGWPLVRSEERCRWRKHTISPRTVSHRLIQLTLVTTQHCNASR